MGKRLYVGSLPFEMTDAQLQELFSACGRVESAKVISDKISGRSKGFGFVEMATDTEAQAAIQKFNGSSVGSRNIVVNEARPMEDRKGGGSGGFRGNRGGGGGFGGGGGGRREGGYGGNSGGGRREGGFGGGKDDFGAGNRPRRDRGDGSHGGGRRSPDGESFGNRW
jgi:cold-inducible RNA-binding protein